MKLFVTRVTPSRSPFLYVFREQFFSKCYSSRTLDLCLGQGLGAMRNAGQKSRAGNFLVRWGKLNTYAQSLRPMRDHVGF